MILIRFSESVVRTIMRSNINYNNILSKIEQFENHYGVCCTL